MKKTVISLTASVLLLMACKKDKPGEPTYPDCHVKLNPTALEFINLPLNRYYIYKDSANGTIDSVRVTKSILEKRYHYPHKGTNSYFDPGRPSYYSEKYSLSISTASNQLWFTGLADSDFYFDNIQFRLLGNPLVYIDSNFYFSGTSDNISHNSFWYPFNSDLTRLHTFIPMLAIEGTTYSDVHQFFSSNGLQPTEANYNASVYYWAKGIGIIKKEIISFNSVKTSLLLRYG